LAALEMANHYATHQGDFPTENVVKRASAYLDFLTGAGKHPGPTPEAPKAAPAEKPAKVEAKAKEPGAEKVAEPEKAKDEPESNVVSYDVVKALIIEQSKVGKRDVVVKVLGEFGVEKGPDLKPEQYASFVEKLKAAA
jgi:hypothetical protein